MLHGRNRLGTMKNRLVAVLPQAARALGRIFVKVCKSAPSLNFLWTISEKRFIIAYHGEGSGSMRFTKMQGIGNDYIYVNCFEETVREPERLAVEMSRAHYGVGADGLVLDWPQVMWRIFPCAFLTVTAANPKCAERLPLHWQHAI